MADPGRTPKRGAVYKFLTQCKGGGSGIDSGRPVSWAPSAVLRVGDCFVI